ncbi:MAG TPA: multidrug effflux MFS transporter [Marinagarivorans sp.]
MSHLRIAIPLAATGAVAPFALDTYLPAFPQMAAALGVSAHDISLSVSIYILVLALGQLVGGPLADRYGRRVVMSFGLGLFIASSLAISQVQSLLPLYSLRAVQAFGGGCLMVCVPALVRDRLHGKEAAKMFSLIGLMAVAAPAIAPSVGAFLLRWDWPAVFYFLAAYGLINLAVLQLTLFRRPAASPSRLATTSSSNAGDLGDSPMPSAWGRYWMVLKTAGAPRYVLLQGCIFSVMMLFVTHASFIYQSHFNVSNSTFALLFGANIVAMWFSMLANRMLLSYFESHALLRVAVCVQALAVVALTAGVALQWPVYFYAPALMLCVGMVGITSPNCQACYMDHFAVNGATAAALMGAMQFGLSGTLSALSTFLPENMLSIVLLQLACSVAAVVLVVWPLLRQFVPYRGAPITANVNNAID